jgi:hypothetical protein
MFKLILICALLVNQMAFAANKKITGTAKNLTTGKFAYTEIHDIELDEQGFNKLIKSEYKNEKGEVFATVTSDFSKSKFVPNIIFKDNRFDKTEELTTDEKNKKISIKTSYSKKNETKSDSIKWEENSVAGQGFDNYLKANFEKLNSGETLSIRFVVVPKHDDFKFGVKKIKAEGSSKVTFGLIIESFFLKMFINRLDVDYAIQGKSLVKYSGLSNLDDDNGKSQNVVIEYTEDAKAL